MFKRNLLIGLVTALLLLGIFGCINYEQEINFKEDLSGTTHVHYWVTGTEGEGNLPTVDAPLNEEGIKSEYGEIEGLKLSNVKVEEKEGETHCEMDFEFNNFSNFLKTELGNLTSESYFKVNDDGNFEFLGVIEGEETEEGSQEMLAEYVYNMTVNMPGSVIKDKTNGEVSGSTVKWEYKLNEIVSKPRTELKAVSSPGGGFSLFSGVGLIILIVIIIVIVIIIIVIIIAASKASKKKEE